MIAVEIISIMIISDKDEVYMIRILPKRILAAVLVLIMLSATTAYATTTQEDIDNVKNQIDGLQDQKDAAEGEVTDITNHRQELEGNLGTLNGQLSQIVADINELESQIEDKEAQIAEAEEALALAQEQCAQQYEDMKLRIQFMYENSNTTTWQMLLESSSFTEFLNRTEYISQINNYDREMLVEFQNLQADIAEQKAVLEGEKDELVAMHEDMEQKQASVNSLINTTRNNIAQADSDLADAQADVAELERKIAEMEEYERQLEIKKALEDAARLAAIREQEQEDTSGVIYVPTDSDAYLLGAIIQCESDGEPYEGKLAVGSVVLNRVKSSYFPNTISGVIYQSGQFSPVASGRLAYRLEAGVNSTCLQAAQEVLNGNITNNCLYFRRNNGIIEGTVIGNHVFY